MRVFITGPTGSGKSTLSQELSRLYNITVYSLDDIHWLPRPGGDQRRPLEEKIQLLQEIVHAEHWVIEGVQFKWTDLAIASADTIIVLDMPAARNWWQIVKRSIKQYVGIETAAYKPGIKSLIRAFRWSAGYRSHERALLMTKLLPFRQKTLIVNSPTQAISAVREYGLLRQDTHAKL